jgi:hypothetical protein
MRRRCCARFGWGGKLVTVKAPLGKDTSRPVVISSVLSEPELAVHSRRFEQAMVSNLQEYCLQKVAEEDKAEGEYWSFIKVKSLFHCTAQSKCFLSFTVSNQQCTRYASRLRCASKEYVP